MSHDGNDSQSPPRVHLSWFDIIKGVERMEEMAPGPALRRIIAVARGGLTPAHMLAHRLKIRRVETILIYARNPDGTQLDFPVVQGFPPAEENGTVIVEDIVDTGRTYETLRRLYPETPMLSLVSRKRDVKGVIEVPDGAWVVFPWETA